MKFLSSAFIIIVFGCHAFHGIPLTKVELLGGPRGVNMAVKALTERHSGDPKSCPPGMWTCSSNKQYDNRQNKDLALSGYWLLLKKKNDRKKSHKGARH